MGNDVFDRTVTVQAKSIEDVLENAPDYLILLGKFTIEQFVRIEIEEVNE